MTSKRRGRAAPAIGILVGVCLVSTGCMALPRGCTSCRSVGCMSGAVGAPVAAAPVARELNKIALPPYVIEPPDVLTIDTLRVVPLPPYRIEPLDMLILQVNPNALKPQEPISGMYPVEPNGTVNLGFSYGVVRVAGLTLDDATKAIEAHLKRILTTAPAVTVALGQSRAMQQIRGEHLVRQDGTIGLGLYGSVYVLGMTIAEARSAIEEHLAEFLQKPEVSLDVAAYNSKVYYIVLDGGGFGKQIVRMPVYGGETVLDALANVNGTPAVSSKNCVWVARPAPAEMGGQQILPVDLVAITENGSPATNYQVMPNDRIYVKADRMIAFDNLLTKVLNPVNRVFGTMLLGSYGINGVQGRLTGGGFGFGVGTTGR